jgi:hypothetical protein
MHVMLRIGEACGATPWILIVAVLPYARDAGWPALAAVLLIIAGARP